MGASIARVSVVDGGPGTDPGSDPGNGPGTGGAVVVSPWAAVVDGKRMLGYRCTNAIVSIGGRTVSLASVFVSKGCWSERHALARSMSSIRVRNWFMWLLQLKSNILLCSIGFSSRHVVSHTS